MQRAQSSASRSKNGSFFFSCRAARAAKSAARYGSSFLRSRSGGIVIGRHVQAVEEVLAEAPTGDLLAQVAVRRGDEPHVDVARLGSRGAALRRPPARAGASPAVASGSSPISSRNTVPPSAASKQPGLRAASAPVNAPRSWPKSSLSSSVSGSAAQLSATNGASRAIGPLRGSRARRPPCRRRSRRGRGRSQAWSRPRPRARRRGPSRATGP